MGSKECHLKFLRKVEPCSVNMVTDAKLVDVPEESPTLNKRQTSTW